ncbi:MAG: hypothetical protein J6M14_07315 [Campylobacter sp.]|nr:hypothetical protein [Campylobacter sp.]
MAVDVIKVEQMVKDAELLENIRGRESYRKALKLLGIAKNYSLLNSEKWEALHNSVQTMASLLGLTRAEIDEVYTPKQQVLAGHTMEIIELLKKGKTTLQITKILQERGVEVAYSQVSHFISETRLGQFSAPSTRDRLAKYKDEIQAKLENGDSYYSIGGDLAEAYPELSNLTYSQISNFIKSEFGEKYLAEIKAKFAGPTSEELLSPYKDEIRKMLASGDQLTDIRAKLKELKPELGNISYSQLNYFIATKLSQGREPAIRA